MNKIKYLLKNAEVDTKAIKENVKLIWDSGISKKDLFLSKRDYQHNVGKWVTREDNILFVNGLSGSGKSHLSRKICKLYDAYYIELDMVKFELRNKYKNAKTIESDWYIKYINEKVERHGRVVVEGWQMRRIDMDFILKHAIIVKRTSFIKSCYRAVMRQSTEERIKRYGEKIDVWFYVFGNVTMGK